MAHAASRVGIRFGHTVAIICWVCGGALALGTAATALWESTGQVDLPDLLAIVVERLPHLFPIHMAAGGLALLLVPAAYLLRRRPRWHRPVGRITAATVLIAAVTALFVAWNSASTLPARAGFFVQGVLWLVLLTGGIVSIRRRKIAAHRCFMLLMAAVTSGALVFRVLLASWAAFLPLRYFKVFYAADAWAAWLLPLSAMGVFLAIEARRKRGG